MCNSTLAWRGLCVLLFGLCLLTTPLYAECVGEAGATINGALGFGGGSGGGLAELIPIPSPPVKIIDVGVGWRYGCPFDDPDCGDGIVGTENARVKYDIAFFVADGTDGAPGTELRRISATSTHILDDFFGVPDVLHHTDLSEHNVVITENQVYVGILYGGEPGDPYRRYYLNESYNNFEFPEGSHIAFSRYNPTWGSWDHPGSPNRRINICASFESVTPDVAPPAPVNIGGCSGLDPAKPTVVLTHGLQDDDVDQNTELWTGNGPMQASTLIRNALGDSVNICQFIWEGAFQEHFLNIPTKEAYLAARGNVSQASRALSATLLDQLGSDYDQPIHFIGHSLGVPVNAFGALFFLQQATLVERFQFTALDRPHHISTISGISNSEEKLYNFGKRFLEDVLVFLARPVTEKRIENYYSFNLDAWTLGVGDKALGTIYNHVDLKDPGRLDTDLGFQEGVNNDHTGVHQWYRWTIDPTIESPAFPGIQACADGEFSPDFVSATGFDESLSPCATGWHWSQHMNPNDFPPPNSPTGTFLNLFSAGIAGFVNFGCTAGASSLQCTETLARGGETLSAGANLLFPIATSHIQFEYRFSGTEDGDYAVLALNGGPIWNVSAEIAGITSEFQSSGPVTVGDISGNHFLSVLLFGVGSPDLTLEVQNIEFIHEQVLFADGFESGNISLWD